MKRSAILVAWLIAATASLPQATVDASLAGQTRLEARPGIYVVEPGDSLWDIAQRYGTSVQRIIALNRLKGSLIRVDQRLLVPGAGTGTSSSVTSVSASAMAAKLYQPDRSKWSYRVPSSLSVGLVHTVRQGETISALAQRYSSTVSSIMVKNKLSGHIIRVGQKLAIPRPMNSQVVSRAWPGDYSANLWMLARVIHGEARGESYEGKVAVGAVVLNRLQHPKFPKTIMGVIKQPGAFTAISDGQFKLHPDESSLRAAREALNGWDPTRGALFYYNPSIATARWSKSRPVVKSIGHHIFTM